MDYMDGLFFREGLLCPLISQEHSIVLRPVLLADMACKVWTGNQGNQRRCRRRGSNTKSQGPCERPRNHAKYGTFIPHLELPSLLLHAQDPTQSASDNAFSGTQAKLKEVGDVDATDTFPLGCRALIVKFDEHGNYKHTMCPVAAKSPMGVEEATAADKPQSYPVEAFDREQQEDEFTEAVSDNEDVQAIPIICKALGAC